MSYLERAGPAPPGAWVAFEPGPLRRSEPLAERFRHELLQSMRVAQGFDIEIRLTWSTGPSASIELGATGPLGRGWLDGTLTRAYGPGRWVDLARPRDSTPIATRAVGRLPVGGTLPPTAAGEAEPWSAAVTRALLRLPAGLQIRWTLRPRPPGPLRVPAPPPLEPEPAPNGWRLAPLTSSERELRDSLDRSHRAKAWSALVEIGADRTVPDEVVWRVSHLLQVATATQGGSALSWHRASRWARIAAPWFSVSEEEAAALLPEPWGGVGTTAESDAPNLGLVVGTRADGRRVRLAVPRGEGRHLVVLGETGMGKSSALVALALSAVRHAGVILFDPVGDTAREFLRRLPPNAIPRSIWISPEHSPIPVNALAGLGGGGVGRLGRDKPLNDLVAAFRRVRAVRFADSPFWGPRIEETLSRALRIAAAVPRGTLVDAETFVTRAARRHVGVPSEVEADATELRILALERPDEVEGARRVLSEVTRNETLRSLLCAPDARLEPAQLVAPGSVAVISGDAPTVGSTAASYLLAIHLALAWANLLARPPTSKTMVILDEAQWYAHEAASEMFRLGRRANLHLWLATQALSSLPDIVREAAVTNAADFLVFRGSPVDAREFVRWHPALDEPTLLCLGRGSAVLLQSKGHSMTWLRTPRRIPAPQPVATEASIVARGRAYRVASATSQSSTNEVTEEACDSASITDLLNVIWAALDLSGTSRTVGIPLALLRLAANPPPAAVRELGRILQHGGALGRERRVGGRPGWWIHREAFDRLLTKPPTGEAAEKARARWARVAGGGSGV